HFVWQDFQEVVEDLREAGYSLEHEWFVPHYEFRFPKVGEIAPRGVVVELRDAIEPWLTLGEEAGSGGTARYVDSSVERMQVRVLGAVDGRHTVAVNGVELPLHPTGTVGESVAGVRYRAWQPPSCLHPTIGVHTPLVFDVVDTWSGRSIGGCTYHVAHPGGMSYDVFPVNANAAECRRHSRFLPFGHTPGAMNVRPMPRSKDFPTTLDLRRV
ncbi:MAG: transglutaminase family protein, partial [Planctomycetia bacterium]